MNPFDYQKIAFVFPGQGSQAVGMLKELAIQYPHILDFFAKASDLLGYDLWQLIQAGPAEKLNQTEFTQPALLTAEIAMWSIWQKKQFPEPLFLAGHSLGEYSALVCAGAFDFRDAVKLIARRGQLMQQAVPADRGAMLAVVGLDNAVIDDLCIKAGENQVLAPANYNSIGQTVLAGEKTAIMRAMELAKQAGAKIAKVLEVSVPAHCELMRPVAEKLTEQLNNITVHHPKIPVINNADVEIYYSPEQIRQGLAKQLYSPVRWVETIQFLHKQGVDCIVECGPNKVLGGLNRRIINDLPTLQIEQLLNN